MSFHDDIIEMLTGHAETISAGAVWVGDEVLIINAHRGVTTYKHGTVAKISKQGGLQTAYGEFLIAPRSLYLPVTILLLHRGARPLPTEPNTMIHVKAFGPHIANQRPGLFRYSAREKAWFTFGSAQSFLPGDFRDWEVA